MGKDSFLLLPLFEGKRWKGILPSIPPWDYWNVFLQLFLNYVFHYFNPTLGLLELETNSEWGNALLKKTDFNPTLGLLELKNTDYLKKFTHFNPTLGLLEPLLNAKEACVLLHFNPTLGLLELVQTLSINS